MSMIIAISSRLQTRDVLDRAQQGLVPTHQLFVVQYLDLVIA